MTYEQALQIAIEQLDDAVDYLKAMNKGFPKVEKQVAELMSASNALREALDEAGESYDQAALELCERCGWKTLIPDEGCLNCKRRGWVGLTQEELQDLCAKSYHTDNAGETHFNRGYFADAIEAKLKEKNQ